MAIEVTIHITAEDLASLGKHELAILNALASTEGATAPQKPVVGFKTAEPETKTRRKPGPKPKTQKVEEEVIEEKPAEPVEEKPAAPAKQESIDDIEVEDDEESSSLEAAIQKATDLVASGKAAQVKAALKAAGAKRVSELTEEQVDTFMENLK